MELNNQTFQQFLTIYKGLYFKHLDKILKPELQDNEGNLEIKIKIKYGLEEIDSLNLESHYKELPITYESIPKEGKVISFNILQRREEEALQKRFFAQSDKLDKGNEKKYTKSISKQQLLRNILDNSESY